MAARADDGSRLARLILAVARNRYRSELASTQVHYREQRVPASHCSPDVALFPRHCILAFHIIHWNKSIYGRRELASASILLATRIITYLAIAAFHSAVGAGVWNFARMAKFRKRRGGFLSDGRPPEQ